MDENTRSDLQTIFGNFLADSLMTRLIEHLDGAILTYADHLAIKTRNDKNDILRIQGKTSFAIVDKFNPTHPITTGGLERNRKNNRVPTMRFRVNNSALQSIHGDHEFTYRNPQWTCVEIRSETIDLVQKLLETELADFFSQINPPESTDVIQSRQESPSRVPSPAYDRNPTSVPRLFLILMIALGITAVLVAVLNLPRASENTQPPPAQSAEQLTIPKPGQSDYSKPERLDRETIYSAIQRKFAQSSKGIIKSVSTDAKHIKVTVDYGKYRDASDVTIDVAVALHRIDSQIEKWNRVTVAFPQSSKTFSRGAFEIYRTGSISDLQFLALVE